MVKAVVAGAAGGIGQPLSLLLKTCQLVDELALYDVVNAPGVATDLSHISTPAKVTGYLPKDDGLQQALTGADVVVIPAGIPRKPGMTRDDLFKINAGIVQGLIEGVAKYCPKAFVLVISNPVNSTVPIAAEVLKKAGVFDPKKLFGVTTLDVVRAETFVAEITGEKNPGKLNIPVIGGHSGETIVPLFSQAQPSVNIPSDKLDALVNRVQFGGDEVVKAKEGAGSATLSMAYAGYRFAEKVIKASKGEKGLVEPSFVYLPGVEGGDAIAKATGTDFFSVPIELGPGGAEKAVDVVSSVNDYEGGRSGLEHGLQDCMTKAKMDSQQWRTAQDSLMSLGEQNVASVDSIVRTGMEANQLLRVKLSSAASTALEDVNVASNGFLSSIDCSLKLDHDARASIDSIINPSRNELRALKSGHYHKTVEITANSDKYLEEDYVVDVPSCSTPKKRLINLPTNTSIEELRTPAFEDLLKSFWEAKSASKQISNEDVKHFLGRHDFQTQASRDFNERVPLVDIN